MELTHSIYVLAECSKSIRQAASQYTDADADAASFELFFDYGSIPIYNIMLCYEIYFLPPEKGAQFFYSIYGRVHIVLWRGEGKEEVRERERKKIFA